MKTKIFFLSTLLIAMLGVCGCSGDDEWEEYAQNLDKEFEQIVVDENDDAEDWIGIHLNIGSESAIMSTLDNETTPTVFKAGEPITFSIIVRYLHGMKNPFWFTDEFKTDREFFCIYSEKGKLVKRPDRNKFKTFIEQSNPPSYNIYYNWVDDDWNSLLPKGDYYTKFSVKYNARPKEEKEVWRLKNFEVHFKIR